MMKDWGELENFHLALMERHYGSFSIAANNVSAFPLWKQASCGGTLKPVCYWRVGEGRELEFLFAFSDDAEEVFGGMGCKESFSDLFAAEELCQPG